ncbi:DUF6545 domain-containing protein [Streptomyces sp. NPDC059866]|uniref:DUF6545 domain-containing protein n=1 Tax=Streptomyces sp. NPDC059866 TaxID=3346978 RepID=UPI003660F720
MLLTGRKTVLYDAILALTPYCDPAVREAAYRTARRNADDEARAAVTADAAFRIRARSQTGARRRRIGARPWTQDSRRPACGPWRCAGGWSRAGRKEAMVG